MKKMQNKPLAIILALALAALGLCALAQDTITAGGQTYTMGEGTIAVAPAQGGAPLDADKLQQMVAPIALYPDAVVSQILIAATYPVQVVEAYQWLQKNQGLPGDQAQNAAQSQGWDPSVAGLCLFPQIVERMFKNLEWSQDLGEAFLAQQKDVMDAVQIMRQKAFAAGNLKSSSQQTVAQQDTTIVIQPADPQIIYVPAYDPTVIYGAWAPAAWYYPAAVYAPWPGYYPGSGILAFGAGVAVGAAWAGAWGCDWHGGNVYIHNNVYNRVYGPGGTYRGANGTVSHYGNTTAAYNKNTGEVHSYNSATGNARSTGGGDTSNWQHDGSQRSGQSYGNDSLNKKYGGGGYGDADRGFGESGGAGGPSGGSFEGLHMSGGGGGGTEQAASDRGWSSRSSGGGGGGDRGGGGGFGGAGFDRGGGFGGGGGGGGRRR